MRKQLFMNRGTGAVSQLIGKLTRAQPERGDTNPANGAPLP